MEQLWNIYAVRFEALMETTKIADKETRTAAFVKFEAWRNTERSYLADGTHGTDNT